jgi:cell division control protein 24
VENFMIKFQNEDTMKKWAAGLDQQRKENAPQTQSSNQPPPNFAWIGMNPADMVDNPYKDEDDEDEQDEYNAGRLSGTTVGSAQASMSMAMPGTLPRNASSSNLRDPSRNRSATSDSTGSLGGMARAPPPRFPMIVPPQAGALPPPDGGSVFSPASYSESPVSTRTSTTSGIFGGSAYPFPQATPQPWNGDADSNRYTAPAMPRPPSRDTAPGMNGRNPRGPSMPVMPREPNQLQQQQRSRSYSTPDINGQAARNGQSIPAVPGIPPHLHQNYPPHPTHARHDSSIPRSNTGSPANELPSRTNTNSPGTQRARQYGGTMAQFPTQPIYPRQGTPGSVANLPPPGPPPVGIPPLVPVDPSRSITPGLATAPLASSHGMVPPTPDLSMPNQLKVMVNYESGNYFTLVVQFNITYQSLIDRIDVKLARLTPSSIGRGDLKLRYQDEDGDFVTIESDDDIQIAISEWREGQGNAPGGLGEIELFCVGDLS